MASPTLASKIFMTSLETSLFLVSTIGNGSFIAIFARFKNLRSFPNILFVNLAAVDFLNAVINIPLHALTNVWEPSWMRGKTLAITISSLHLEFTLLNMVSMFAITLDRFGALYLDLKYYTWKTTRKAYAAVVLVWLICTVPVALSTIPLLQMDMEADKTLAESRGKVFQHRKNAVASTMAFFIAASTALGILTGNTIHRKKKQRTRLNLPPPQVNSRLKQDIKATITVALAVVTYFICYAPALALAIWKKEYGMHNDWVTFLVGFCTFISSASNPIIYVLRNRRYRDAIRQLVKDPFGSSPFQEMPEKIKQKEQSHPGPGMKKREGGEPGTCSGYGENLENEAGVIENASSHDMAQEDRIVKIAWELDEEESSCDQACQHGLEVVEADQEDSLPAEEDCQEGGSKMVVIDNQDVILM